MQASTSNKRRDYFIKKWLQFKFSFLFIAVIVVSNTLFGIYIFNKVKQYLNYHLYTSHITIKNTWEVIAPILKDATLWLIAGTIVLFLIVIYSITKNFSSSFKILLEDLKILKSGDLSSDFNVNAPSELENFKNDYKELKKYLRTNIGEAKESISKLDSITEKLETYANEKNKKGAVLALEEMELYYSRLQASINKINT